ncbi:MAG TPA: bis-aminopropyl spermidine synthase family protein [Streptosporangiaceae bacterium]|nr:bis-aminopropyl spermidine synthase family protein [Streptosporangiaceae bacterium]
MGGYPTVCGRPATRTGRRHGRAPRVRAHLICWEPGTITIASTADTVLAEVAAATGLAEGPAGVRDVILAISRTEPVAVRAVSQLAELPVPIVTAICNELRKRGVVDRSRPVRLTEAGREVFGGGQPGLSARCPECGGRGVASPELRAELTAGLTAAAEAAPEAKPELDQTHCTVDTKISRVLAMHEAGALAGTRILLLGDDDLVSVAIARFAGLHEAASLAGRVRQLTVVDTDQDVLDCIAAQTAGSGLGIRLVRHDLRQPLPAELAGAFDVACTDPPYTVAGAELFLSRAVAALAPGGGQHVFFSFGARRPADMLRTQQVIAGLGLVLRGLTPNFNEYVGAGVLAGTSHLYHLRTAAGAEPLITGAYEGPLYTADHRAAVTRPYQCANCRAVHPVGPGARWPKIASLQAEGCPDCGGTVFRPMPLKQR